MWTRQRPPIVFDLLSGETAEDTTVNGAGGTTPLTVYCETCHTAIYADQLAEHIRSRVCVHRITAWVETA